MREIKFRGQRIDNGEWVYGSLIKYPNGRACIAFEQTKPVPTYQMVWVEILPDTVGQFTGLKDRNGKEIYEGDIVSSPHFKDRAGRQHDLFHIVQWSDRYHGWFLLSKASRDPKDGSIQLFVADNADLTVNGTIHDKGEAEV